ncbi:MAG: DUF411 domain-containing protein [Gemmatimonadota bacterium]
MNRRRVARLALAALLPVACGRGEVDTAAELAHAANAAAGDTVVVYKTPTCGCCTKWVDHMRENGFAVVTHDLDNLEPIKRQLGVPAGRISCHTARVRGYTLEGHVPADLVQRMLAEEPRIKGLTVPGMPMGSPGMEGLYKDDFQVLSFDEAGRTEVYAER